MADLLAIGAWLLPLLYLALLVDYGATFFLRTRTAARSPWLVGCVAVHAALVAARAVHVGRLPLAHLGEILSVLALATAAVYAVVEFSSRDRRTGVFVILLVFLFQYTASVLPEPSGAGHAAAEAPAGWGRLHVVGALVAYTSLGFAGVYGLLHLAARRDLRRRRFGVLFDRLPPLDLLARMTWHALLVGSVFMTIALVTSPLMFGHGAGAVQPEVMSPKIVIKIIAGSMAWLISAAAVLGRAVGKWPPARISGIAVAGFALVMGLLVASGLLS